MIWAGLDWPAKRGILLHLLRLVCVIPGEVVSITLFASYKDVYSGITMIYLVYLIISSFHQIYTNARDNRDISSINEYGGYRDTIVTSAAMGLLSTFSFMDLIASRYSERHTHEHIIMIIVWVIDAIVVCALIVLAARKLFEGFRQEMSDFSENVRSRVPKYGSTDHVVQ